MTHVAAAGLFVLRLTMAFVLVSRGGNILFGLGSSAGLGAGGLDAAAAKYTALGLEPGMLVAAIAGIVQFVGGSLIAIGLLARWAALAAVGLIAIRLWKEQASWPGIELSLVLIGALVCLWLTGAGDWSFDGRREKTAASRAAARARARRR